MKREKQELIDMYIEKYGYSEPEARAATAVSLDESDGNVKRDIPLENNPTLSDVVRAEQK